MEDGVNSCLVATESVSIALLWLLLLTNVGANRDIVYLNYI